MDQAQEKVNELASRVGESDSELKRQMSQAQAWEQRNAENERARSFLEGELRKHIEHEDGLKAKCTAFELQLVRIGESLAQTRAKVADEEASRAAIESRIEELCQLQIAAGRELAERASKEEQLRRELETQALELQCNKDELARVLQAARERE